MKWISIKEKLPEHDQTVYVYTPKGQAVCTFVDSVKMNEVLNKNGFGNEAVNVKIHPYYFCSQEIRQYTVNGVTHWASLIEPPSEN